MRKILFPFLFLLFIFPADTWGAKLNGSDCPKTETLMTTTDQDQEELIRALGKIFSKDYGSSLLQWRVEIIKPMTRLTGLERNHYKTVMRACGKDVADRSWFVRLRYHRLFPTGAIYEFYMVKNKNHKWGIWHRNR
ncbi:hypothetical protein [Neobacillus sp. Marseille-QA0830]